jgi:hypothetical protein
MQIKHLVNLVLGSIDREVLAAKKLNKLIC